MTHFPYVGQAGDYIILDFGCLDTSNGAKLILRTDEVIVPKTPCIKIQILSKTGDWIEVGTLIPRVYWSTDIIDLTPYLLNVGGSLKIRLYFTHIHKIDYVAVNTTQQAQIQIVHSQLISAIHSKEGIITLKLLYQDKNMLN